MARTNRRDILADGEIQVVHCINRCVRRAHLCGQDPLTGAHHEHRREFIRQRMEFLQGIMGVGDYLMEIAPETKGENRAISITSARRVFTST